MSGGNYEWAIPHIAAGVRRIVEVGSRDALDAIALSRRFDCQVVAFEPNPTQFAICARNVSDSKCDSVSLRSEALTDADGPITFWQVDEDCYPNPGASSLFEINFANRSRRDPDRARPPIQRPVTVRGARWDSLNLSGPDLLVIDVEGAELRVLKGFGRRLRDVK